MDLSKNYWIKKIIGDKKMNDAIREKLKNYIVFSKKIKNVNDLVGLPVDKIKGMTKKSASILKKTHQVAKIGDLSDLELDSKDMRNLENQGIKKLNLVNWMVLSKVIKSNELENYLGPKKIVLVGLNNAGKTALTQILKNNYDINTFGKILPTKGVERITISSNSHEYIIWDMGGQESYRMQYLKNTEKYFLNVELIMFVIDVLDKSNYNTSILYLKDILNSLEFLKEQPNFLVLIHKVDPDIKDEEEVIENIKFLEKKINEVFQGKEFKYDVSTSSIYQTLSKDPKVSQDMKTAVSSEQKVREEVKDAELGTCIEKTLNMMINLSASIEERLTNIEKTMDYTVQWVEYFKKAMPIKSPTNSKEQDEEEKIIGKTLSIRQAVTNELKSILKMRRID